MPTRGCHPKGQVVIPEEVRNEPGLNEGDRFVVIGQGDAVILKVITPTTLEEFQELLSQARAEAKRAGVKKADLKSAIAKSGATRSDDQGDPQYQRYNFALSVFLTLLTLHI